MLSFCGRERCHVFTDDADLLARRVTDSHERKAAVELQALRDDLAKLGFVRKEVLAHGQQLKEKAPSPVTVARREDFRIVRRMRQTRATRFTRLAPVQRLVQVVEELRRWFAERLGVEQTETVKPEQKIAETVAQAEKIAPAVKETPGQKLRREIERSRQQQQQRRSGGMHV